MPREDGCATQLICELSFSVCADGATSAAGDAPSVLVAVDGVVKQIVLTDDGEADDVVDKLLQLIDDMCHSDAHDVVEKVLKLHYLQEYDNCVSTCCPYSKTVHKHQMDVHVELMYDGGEDMLVEPDVDIVECSIQEGFKSCPVTKPPSY